MDYSTAHCAHPSERLKFDTATQLGGTPLSIHIKSVDSMDFAFAAASGDCESKCSLVSSNESVPSASSAFARWGTKIFIRVTCNL